MRAEIKEWKRGHRRSREEEERELWGKKKKQKRREKSVYRVLFPGQLEVKQNTETHLQTPAEEEGMWEGKETGSK